jgi:organic radical activating enzyme
MEHTSTVEPTISISYMESTGDSEADMVPDTAVSHLCDITKPNTSSTDDEDAESTSEEFVDAKEIEDEADKNKRRRSWLEASCKTIREESSFAQMVGKKEMDDKEAARKEAVEAQGDAESDRRFWEACIAHGY